MSSPSPPLLGTPYIQSQSSSSSTPTLVTPSTCQNLSSFKSLLRQSRSLDDSITVRLNRANALSRNTGGRVGGGECESVWKELSERWGERNRVLSYCDQVLAGQGEERRRNEESGLSAEKGELGRGRSTERELKRQQLHQEFSIERVIRHRTISLLFSKCPGLEDRIKGESEKEVVEVPRALGQEGEEEERRRRRGRDERGGVRWA